MSQVNLMIVGVDALLCSGLNQHKKFPCSGPDQTAQWKTGLQSGDVFAFQYSVKCVQLKQIKRNNCVHVITHLEAL